MAYLSRKFSRSVNVVLALVAVLASYQSTLAEESSMRLEAPAKGRFSAQIVLAPDAQSFMKDYLKGGPVSVPDKGRMSLAGPLQSLMYLVAGCAADAKGACNVTATLSIFRPDGEKESSVMTMRDGASSPELDVVVGRSPPPPGQWDVVKMAEVIRFFKPKTAMRGEYLILAVFTDHNADDRQLATWRVVHVTG